MTDLEKKVVFEEMNVLLKNEKEWSSKAQKRRKERDFSGEVSALNIISSIESKIDCCHLLMQLLDILDEYIEKYGEF